VFLAKLRAAKRALICRRRGHQEQCAIAVYLESQVERHIHVCSRCGVDTKDETTPISSELRTLMADIGLPIAEQARYMH
jgi:hypothetical protein